MPARGSKEQFLGTVAHELRNALTPLMMGLPILKSTPGNGSTAQRIHEMIERQVAHMNRLVNDLLDMTRVGYGKIRLDMCRVDLNDVVRSVVETHRVPFEQQQIRLDAAYAPGPVHVMGDPVRLVQVLGNLLQNALKFTDRNGQVSASVTAGEGRATVRVRDTGIGIPPESVGRLFDPFVQASTIDRNRGGLGLGLALVKNLVEMHGGSVWATSAGLGQGAEFVVCLPLIGREERVSSGSSEEPLPT